MNDSISCESKIIRRTSQRKITSNRLLKRQINNQKLRKTVNNQNQRIRKQPNKLSGPSINWEWKPQEKNSLFEALKKYGPLDFENLKKAVPTKR